MEVLLSDVLYHHIMFGKIEQRVPAVRAKYAVRMFFLHCELSLAAPCIVIGPVWVCACVCVCVVVGLLSRNSNLRASIFTKLA